MAAFPNTLRITWIIVCFGFPNIRIHKKNYPFQNLLCVVINCSLHIPSLFYLQWYDDVQPCAVFPLEVFVWLYFSTVTTCLHDRTEWKMNLIFISQVSSENQNSNTAPPSESSFQFDEPANIIQYTTLFFVQSCSIHFIQQTEPVSYYADYI